MFRGRSWIAADGRNWWVAFSLALIGIIGVAGTVVGVVLWIPKAPDRPEILLPILTVAGVVALLATLSAVAVAYSALNLQDKSHALGLPEGSVRSVIALSLIVIFTISAVFLYSSLATVSTKQFIAITQAQLDAIPRDQIISQKPIEPKKEGDPTLYDVETRVEQSQASQDFAQQMLTALITLVTAVAAFYFGSKAVVTAQGGGGQAALRIMKPDSPVSLARAGASLPITVATSPIGEAVTWDPPQGDSDGTLKQTRFGEFEYVRGAAAEDSVTLRFRLVSNPAVSQELIVKAT
ncbi:MAG: hypothetical protein HY680_00995 [Chloroflexi bacterium]|nr:hypothetical protein [Chloroflexota bacterium]